MRKFPDGTMVFPAKGKPPKPIEGYYAHQPYVHKPLLKPCQYRGFERIKRDCECPDRISMACKLKGRINAGSCLGCTDRKEVPFLRKALNYTEALVYGESVKEETFTKRIDTCRICHYNENSKCTQCGCNIFELARYKENLPKWGCKHPERGKAGWSV